MDNPEIKTLAHLSVGETAEITGISQECDPIYRRRLLDLGFVLGSRVQVAFSAPKHNPRAYLIQHSCIALRNEQADFILIQKISENAQ